MVKFTTEGVLTVIATGFGGDKESYKLPDKPKEAAVSTFSEYMNASMSRDYDKMLSLSDDYRFKTEWLSTSLTK